MTTVSRAAKFAERTAHLRASTIREMLKVTQQPDVISFGGGLPAPELFPTAAIAQAAHTVMERYGSAALQYSVTEGIPEMRVWVAERLTRRFGRIFDAESVTIVNGSQQGLDLVGKSSGAGRPPPKEMTSGCCVTLSISRMVDARSRAVRSANFAARETVVIP
ncbi:MAG TPA: hypothetical protein VMF61_01900 [Candidatus Acidoferrales bacterium]|nr:hypothetical protein [Candidatus Acidoferrales bacterium]